MAIRFYQNRTIATAEVIEALMAVAREMGEADPRCWSREQVLSTLRN